MPHFQLSEVELNGLQWEYERQPRRKRIQAPKGPRYYDVDGSYDAETFAMLTNRSNVTRGRRKAERRTSSKVSVYIFLLCISIFVFPTRSFGADGRTYAPCPQQCRCQNGSSNATAGFSLSENYLSSSSFVTNCSGSGLSAWPAVIASTTTVLLLDDNKFRRLDNVSMRASQTVNMTGVETLSLTSNLISYINKRAFDGFDSLSGLLLHHNLLDDLQWTSSLSNKHLTFLDLSHNSITKISPGVLESLSFLKRLDISHNYITVVHRFSFCGFSNLESLDLTANALTNGGLQHQALSRLKSLKHLSLAENRGLSRVPDFAALGLGESRLEELDMQGLSLLTHVQTFAFDELRSLQKLNLSRCAIDRLSQGWLNGGPERTLETLDLSHNRIRQIDAYSLVAVAAYGRYTDAATFTRLPLDASALPYVISPSVGQPNQQITPVLPNNPNLPILGEEWYVELDRLRWLSLANNYQLSFIADSAFAYLPLLNFLFLQNCNITRANIAAPQHRQKDQAIKLTFPSLNAIWLYNNPFYCDCYMRDIRYAARDVDGNSSECNQVGADGTSSAENGARLDPKTYAYGGRCHQMAGVQTTVCFLPETGGQPHPLQAVPMSELRCAIEPMSWVFTLLIGPLAFAASIGIVMLCGSCSVMVRRIRRYRSGKYLLMDEKMALKRRDRVFAAHDGVRTQRSRVVASSVPGDRSPERSRYGTNLVLSGMAKTSSSEGLFHLPDFLSVQPRQKPRSRPSSPNQKRSVEALLSVPSSHHYRETSFSSRHDFTSSKSFPDVSNLEKTGVKYWKHEVKTISKTPRDGATAPNVEYTDLKLPLLNESRHSKT